MVIVILLFRFPLTDQAQIRPHNESKLFRYYYCCCILPLVTLQSPSIYYDKKHMNEEDCKKGERDVVAEIMELYSEGMCCVIYDINVWKAPFCIFLLHSEKTFYFLVFVRKIIE